MPIMLSSRIAHIVNPFNAETDSDLYIAQPITYESMRRAQHKAQGIVEVELLCVQYKEDANSAPAGFKRLKDLSRSVSDLAVFNKPMKLPLIADILQRAFDESDADYIIYTNVDIGLYEGFYTQVSKIIADGHDAFIINRRRLHPLYSKPSELESIYNETGKKHPGFDCFVFHRNLFKKMKLDGICIGVPFIEISLSQNLFALAKNFKLFEDEILTFHIGMEIFRRRAPSEYFWHNRRMYHLIERQLLPQMKLNKFPYHEKPLPLKLLKWALHPCIPTRLVIKLLLRGNKTEDKSSGS